MAIVPLDVTVRDAVVLEAGRPELDPELIELGRPHLEAIRAINDVFDGPTLCWTGPHERGGIRVVRGSYFDMLATCDAIRVEGAAGPLRDRAVAAAGDHPTMSGTGRAAAVGVTVVATRPDGDGRSLTIGRRSRLVAADPGRWHLAPSGMLEDDPSGGDAHLAATVSTELAEELGIEVSPADVVTRARVLGLVHDLARLRPDLVVRLDLTADEAMARPTAGAEFVEMRQVEASFDGISELLSSAGTEMTAPAAGALRLLRDSLRSEPVV